MQVKEVLQKTTLFLRGKGIETARLDSELLISTALKWQRMNLFLNYEYPLSEEEISHCRELVRRRSTGEPVAYIIGKKDFFNHSFVVNSDVLIPRPETEQVVEDTVKWIRTQPSARVLDLGTGSGCIGLSILAEVPEARLIGVDVSQAALNVAKENAEKMGLSDRATFVQSDIASLSKDQASSFQPLDAVVANPPYISKSDSLVEKSVVLFEPEAALFAEENGLASIRQWVKCAADWVRPGGWIMFEIGHDQGTLAREIFDDTRKLCDVKVVKDLSGRDRYVRALKKPDNYPDNYPDN